MHVRTREQDRDETQGETPDLVATLAVIQGLAAEAERMLALPNAKGLGVTGKNALRRIRILASDRLETSRGSRSNGNGSSMGS